ncbi:hypothetical protein SCUCBS95973_000751 [Sporothrix curviconia]|uniref:Histidine acid phosphatase n=1 Tax=Sporothrix curviconia TaxID=1260050 RepID=A0ABP0ASW5_9PEZI
MSDSVGARWAVRIVAGTGLLLAIHLLVVALILPANDPASVRPWPLSLEFSFLGQSGSSSSSSANANGDAGKYDNGDVPVDGFHNFGAPQDPETPPPGSPWYAPRASHLNNLTTALSPSTKGVYGFLFNDSTTPEDTYGVYNWCNMPHVRRAEYVVPPADEHRTLIYVELVHRHHKRTPYAANGFPQEAYPWDCEDARIHLYGQPSGLPDNKRPGIAHYAPAYDTPGNPFLRTALGWHGSCQFPQLTSGGLEDAWQHGADLYDVYHGLLRILPSMDDAAAWHDHVAFRVTNNPITSQTVTMVLGGMAAAAGLSDGSILDIPLLVEAAGYDGLEPQYTCPAAAALFEAIIAPAPQDGNGDDGVGSSPVWADHLERLAPLFAKLDAASGVDPANPRGFHASVDHYYDNLSARQCHGQPPVKDVSQEMADMVFRVGQWEYSRMYRDDARSLAASVGAWGVWVAQLAGHLRGARDAAASAMDKQDKQGSIRYRHNVAHDGSLSRLLSILQADEMVWPGMGSEVVVELWQTEAGEAGEAGERQDSAAPPYDVRVLFGGKVLRSSHPELGLLDMVPLDALLAYIDGLVGVDASLLPAKCNGSRPL